MRSVDSAWNGPVESQAPAAEVNEEAVPSSSPAAAATRGRGLRRWRRIRRGQQQQREGHAAAAAGDEDSAHAQLHKRRLPVAAGAPKGRREAPAVAEPESSTASVESRFVPSPPARLGPGLGLLVASAGFSVGAGESDNSEDRSSRSSTTASAPPRVFRRHEHALLLTRERDRLPRSRAPAASLRGRNPRADSPRVPYSAAVSAEADNSRSSVESDLRSSNALKARQSGAGLNGIHKVFSDYCDLSDEEQPSEEVRSTGHCKENGSSVVGRSVQISADSGYGVETSDEASVGKGQNGRMHSGADRDNESALLQLQRTQEALENEIEKIMAIGKEATDDFDFHDDEWSGSDHLEEPIDEEVNGRIKHLESRLEEASAVIKEKASRIHELKATAIENSNLLLLQSELDQLYLEKMEAEIQCTILTRAYQASVALAKDQMVALYEAQKSLSADYKQLGLKLQHTENRAMVLDEMAEKLQVQCKELSNSSEVLQLQSKASRVSLFCFVQFILLCIAIGTFLMQLSPSSTEVVPT
ncbi:hypothetical protein BAE44_0018171 [Dichanthelium oligosanthes]|uniref:WPP domain-interacting protein 1 n=1 Tax=Dichanthelium oligosanthes TaxID=888268 RepID=A0A1E5V6N6_9POAL|nr:hypothetical protein BAE44_0018171 [Dichanthelium oligosanthes]